MIVHPEQAKLIARGRKTVFRRPVKVGEQRCWIRPGRSYGIQPGLRSRTIARISILSVEGERLGDISFEDVRAEGFKTTDDFKLFWVRNFDSRWVLQQEAMIVEASKLANNLESTETDQLQVVFEENALARFDDRHADRDVWVVHFELDKVHRPRLLAPSARGERDGDELGYTENPRRALRDEPEAVDAAILEQYTADAEARHNGRPGRREEVLRRRAHSLAIRLRQTAFAATREGMEISRELDLIDEHLRLLESRRKAS